MVLDAAPRVHAHQRESDVRILAVLAQIELLVYNMKNQIHCDVCWCEMVAVTAIHFPHHSPQEILDTLAETFRQQADDLRRMLQFN